MGQLSRLPRKAEGPNVPSLPPRMSRGIKTAPNPFRECRQTGRAERRTHVLLNTEAEAEWIVVHPA
jgi:hypothetical protein